MDERIPFKGKAGKFDEDEDHGYGDVLSFSECAVLEFCAADKSLSLEYSSLKLARWAGVPLLPLGEGTGDGCCAGSTNVSLVRENLTCLAESYPGPFSSSENNFFVIWGVFGAAPLGIRGEYLICFSIWSIDCPDGWSSFHFSSVNIVRAVL